MLVLKRELQGGGKMRFSFLFLALSAAISLPLHAQVSSKLQAPQDCDQMVAEAEVTNNTNVYDLCGFNDPDIAWTKWSGLASQKHWEKALYQLCVRYPAHEYSGLYCEKSANLGYGPALAVMGHRAMDEDHGDMAVQYYTRALQSKELNEEQQGEVAEQLGLYYMEQDSSHYTPSKAVAFFQNAARRRSALSNNIMGVLSYTGDLGVKQDSKQAFEYFWRAALLGCKMAQENIGLFHLARKNQISFEMAAQNMQEHIFTCEETGREHELVMPKSDCDCPKVLAEFGRYSSKPYYLIDSQGTTARLQDHNGATLNVTRGQLLTSDYRVDDIRATAVILTKGAERIIINKYKPNDCLAYCEKNPTATVGQEGQKVKIVPYHFTFTPNECRDIMYYAAALVDTSKPFVGKDRCAMGEGVILDDPLLQLLDENNNEQSALSNAIQNGQTGVAGTQGTAKSAVEPLTKNIVVPKRVRPNVDRKWQARKNISSAAAAKVGRERAAAKASGQTNNSNVKSNTGQKGPVINGAKVQSKPVPSVPVQNNVSTAN